MRSVLIAGCGYVGKALADFLVERNWKVQGWTRCAPIAAPSSRYDVRAVDISDRAAVAQHADEFDAVVHCASTRGGDLEAYRRLYFDGLRNLVEEFGRARVIFTSSTSVYAQTDGSWVTEQSATEPRSETGRILLESEKLALAGGGTVVRVAGIYGPDRSALLQKFLAGEAVCDLEHDRFLNQVHRDDIVTALELLLDRQSTAGAIYNVVDDEPMLRSDCLRWLAAKLNRPIATGRAAASARKRGESNKRVSNARLRGLGWEPRYGNFKEAMERSILPSFADAISASGARAAL